MTFENFIIMLDNHVGLINGFATLLLVVVTIGLAYFNLRLWLAQDRPYLEFRLKPADENQKNIYNFYIKNIGKGPAIDITFKIDNTTYSRKSLDSHEEILLDAVGFVDVEKYINGVQNIHYKDINKKKQKHNSIKFVDMHEIMTADDE